MYLPSGEWAGLKSPPGEVLILIGVADGWVRSRVKMSALVEIAGSGSRFSVKASSFDSGEMEKPPPPSSEKGGTSRGSLGLRSRRAPESSETMKRCERLSPVKWFQWR